MDKGRKPDSRDEELLLKELRQILLREDRDALEQLQEILDNKEQLTPRISPIIKEQIDLLKSNFPDEYRQEVREITKEQLLDSQEDILNLLYPAMGKMIKRYIAHQFQILKDSIDDRVKNTFSSQGILGKIKASLFGINSSDIILSDIDSPIIEEIFVVQRDSGLLMGQASIRSTIDQDVVAGMLTAIKAFVEDAFQKGTEELELIEYDTHAIFTQSFHSYYIAVAMKGSLSSGERDKLSTSLYDFAEKELKHRAKEIDETNFNYISSKLEEYFITTQLNKERTAV